MATVDEFVVQELHIRQDVLRAVKHLCIEWDCDIQTALERLLSEAVALHRNDFAALFGGDGVVYHRTAGHAWTEEEDALLFDTTLTATEIAKKTGHSGSDVLSKLPYDHAGGDETNMDQRKGRCVNSIVATVPSSKNDGSSYHLTATDSDGIVCNCLGYFYRRTCRHLDEWRHDHPDTPAPSQPEPPTPALTDCPVSPSGNHTTVYTTSPYCYWCHDSLPRTHGSFS